MKTTPTLSALALALVASCAVAQEASESNGKTGYEETVDGIYVDEDYCHAPDMWETVKDLPPKTRDRIVDVCINIDTGGPEGRF